MVRPYCVAIGVALVATAMTAAPVRSAAQAAERELLGVRLWRDYSTVLKVHGAPTRVVPGMAAPPIVGAGAISVTAQASQRGGFMMPGAPMAGTSMGLMGPPTAPMMGGMGSFGGVSGPPMMGGGRSMPMVGGGQSMPMAGGMTAPGGAGMINRRREEDEDDIGGGPAMGGMAGSPRMGMGGMSAPMGAMGGPGMGGRSLPMAGGMTAPGGVVGSNFGAGLRAMSGLAGDPALMGAMMGAGMGAGAVGTTGTPGAMGAQSQVTATLPSEDVKETWVYEKGGHTSYFMFNRDGRVIRIQSFGLKGPGATSRSIALGDPISKVYARYGWAGTTIRQGDSVTLDYSQKYHVIFDLMDRHDGKGLRVVGITIAPSEGRK